MDMQYASDKAKGMLLDEMEADGVEVAAEEGVRTSAKLDES